MRATFRAGDGTARARGLLSEARVGELVLRSGDDTYRVPDDLLTGLEVASGRDHPRGALEGLGIGMFVGGFVMGTYAVAVRAGDPDCILCDSASRFLLGSIVGSTFGAGAGLVVGAMIGTRRWHHVWGAP